VCKMIKRKLTELRIERDEVGDLAHGSQMKSDINPCRRIILKYTYG